jgi:hypothetical protein
VLREDQVSLQRGTEDCMVVAGRVVLGE